MTVTKPKPPDGYQTWLAYAVETMNVRSTQLEYLFMDEDPPSRESIQNAVRQELARLVAAAAESLNASEEEVDELLKRPPQATAIRLSATEMRALSSFEHATANCPGAVCLTGVPTGIGTGLKLACTENCRAPIDITDYTSW